MGTLARDSLAPSLATAQDIDTSAVGDGGIVDVQFPQDVGLEATLTTGTSGAGLVHINLFASNDSTMTNEIAVGSLGPISGTNPAGTKFLTTVYVPYRYVRAKFAATGTLTGSADVDLVQPHVGRVTKHPLDTDVVNATRAG